jgi:hypothetical protein
MSGKPNKTENDIIKHKNEYIERLMLESRINKKNYEANALYKSTGQVMPIVGLTDNRSVEEKLLDIENLKQNIAKSIGSISSLTFGINVVQALLNNPLNIDNNLIVFTSQRIPELITNLKKIYAIGIRGDKNDVQQIVNFIVKMYSDSNNFAKQAKDFININPSSSLTPNGLPNLDNYSILKNTFNFILPVLGKFVDEYRNVYEHFDPRDRPNFIENINPLEEEVYTLSAECFEIMHALIRACPSREILNWYLEFGKLTNRHDPDLVNGAREILQELSILFPQPNTIQVYFDKNKKYLEILYNSMIMFNDHVTDYNANYLAGGVFNQSIFDAYKTSLIKGKEVYLKLKELLLPSGEIESADRIDAFGNVMREFYEEYHYQGDDDDDGNDGNSNVTGNSGASSMGQTVSSAGSSGSSGSSDVYSVNQPPSSRGSSRSGSDISYASFGSQGNPPVPLGGGGSALSSASNAILSGVNAPFSAVGNIQTGIVPLVNFWNTGAKVAPTDGNGFKRRRGRPKGSGMIKPYSQTVLENLDLTKGIEPSSKFIKFGKYLLNSHKLKKDNTFSLKHISGGNIIDIPSQRLTEDLGKVIKTIVGGGNPSYNELNKLNESEKNYLHKICSKSNILDKVSIPTPSKDSEEKEIHNFEVMRGEIMSGNDSPELIKKFKLLIIKLQKNNSLPKKEVYEILEDLNSLGY